MKLSSINGKRVDDDTYIEKMKNAEKNHKINCVINNNVKMLWMKIKKKYIHKYINERKNKRLKIKFYFYFLDGLK